MVTERELASCAARPVGSGTKLHYGPAVSGPTVSLRSLARITSYEPGDLVVCAQAGMRLADLQAELAKHNQWLPIDPPFADATLGGILATNSSGPRRFGYGTIRDHLLGLRVVGPGGVTRSGGRVVKNVTGYDLHKLHVGAFGTLGIVTELNLKVRPRPEVSKVLVIACRSFEEAHAKLLEIFSSPLRPVALEALDRNLAKLIPGLPEADVALVGVEGTQPVFERHVQALKPTTIVDCWDALRDLPAKLSKYVRVRIGARPYDLPSALPGGVHRWVRAGTGVAWVDFEPGAELPAGVPGGYACVESAPLDMPGRDRLPWGPPATPLEKSIREALCGKAVV